MKLLRSNARASLGRAMATLIEEYESITTETLARWVQERKQENLTLDFKQLTSGELKKEDRKNFGTMVSAFANSDGGLIVWGVDARKDSEGVDAASELLPIENVDAALSQLEELTGTVVRPTVDGMRHRKLDAGDGRGYLVTLVPESDGGPYMASIGHRCYFKRSGSACYEMEHFDVADMFGRRRRPKLVPKVSYKKERGSTDLHVYVFLCSVANAGRATARDFKIILNWPAETLRHEHNTPMMVHRNVGEPLFPGDTMHPTFYGFRYQMTDPILREFDRKGWPKVTMVIYCEDEPPSTCEWDFRDTFENY